MTMTKGLLLDTTLIICDIGASTIKVGRAGKLVPDVVIPSLAGRMTTPTSATKYNSSSSSSSWSKLSSSAGASASSELSRRLLGDDAIQARTKQKLTYEYLFQDDSTNISSSNSTAVRIKDWALLKELLEYAFGPTKMGIPPSHRHKYKVLIPRPHNMTNHGDMTALAELFLGELQFSAITMQEQAALVLYTKGIESGIVVEMGESITQITPVYKGHAIPKLDRSFKIGGRVLTKYLTKLMQRRGYQQVIEDYVDASKSIKEQFCYVPLKQFVDADRQLAVNTTVLDGTYKLSNGTNVIVGGEQRFGAAEPLFQPSLCNVEQDGLAETIMNVIQEADIDIRADLYQNIILSGGTSLLSGLDERLQQDLNELYNRDVLKNDQSRSMGWTPKVRSSDQKYAVWEGASIVSEFISDERWIKRDEFLRDGIQSVLSKCQV